MERNFEFEKEKPEIFKINHTIKRNEGMNMNIGQKLYKHAKTIIPGGTMLLSKRPEMFLPEKWPSYFKKAKGCKVWDLDGIEYIDMSVMGIGTNILGYSNSEVNDVVKDVVELGNMSTLNCREEVDLADKLIQMHPWSDMARFCRSEEKPMLWQFALQGQQLARIKLLYAVIMAGMIGTYQLIYLMMMV